jgi:hypothetical protein
MIGDDVSGPVAESVDAGAVQCSLSWFKSRPGLQPSRERGFGSASQNAPKMPVDGRPKTLSRLRNLV